MRRVTATGAKGVLGQVLQDAATRIVVIKRRGKPAVAAMPAGDAALGALCAYASGHISQGRAMRLLGLVWYGQLTDALDAAGVAMHVDRARHQEMVETAVSLLGDQV